MNPGAVDPSLELDLWETTLPNGLTVRVDRRPERRTGFCALGVDFGAVDRVLDATGGQVPMGTAHFLEHELFEDEQGDVSDRFSQLGASANAMTGFVGTTFLASTTGDMLPSVELLLRFVQRAIFAEERVARERAVIAQEIRMYDDDPDWRVFAGLLECLYHHHPVRDNIAGTEQSIAGIDPASLAACHARFYRPDNLCLVVSGPVEPEAVEALALKDAAGRSTPGGVRPSRGGSSEPSTLASLRCEVDLDVERPRLLLGFKERELGGGALAVARRQLATRMGLDLLLGPSSAAFEQLYAEGLVDESFGVSHSAEADFAFTTVGGETDDPERLEQRLREILLADAQRALDPAAYGRIRNKLFGSLMRALDSSETATFGLISSHFRGLLPFAGLALVSEVGLDEVRARLASHLLEDGLAVAVLRRGQG